jgi:hypothetical protein
LRCGGIRGEVTLSLVNHSRIKSPGDAADKKQKQEEAENSPATA